MMKKLWFYALSICSVLLVGCNNGDDGLLDVPEGWAHKAESLAVTPKTVDIPMGLTQQLEADAVLETGQTVRVTTDSHLTWSSSDTTIATVDASGLVTGVTQGTVTITALGVNNDGTQVSDTAAITVTDAVVTALTVTPKTKTLANGLTQQYKAEALMSTGQMIDVTTNALLTWSSSDTAIATISGTGLAQSMTKGTTTIKAEGTVNGVTLSDTATLIVGDAVVSDLVVTPVNASVPVGLERVFTADAVMTDGTTQHVTEQATWTTSDPGTALVSDTAGTKGVAEGRAVSATPAEIKASITIDGKDYSASGHLTVTDAVVSEFYITPSSADVPKGLTQDFLAKVKMSDGDILDVTEHADVSWTSSDTSIASVSNTTGTKGQAKGEAMGTVTITATGTVAGKTWQDDATLNVTNAVVSSIQVTPVTDSTPVGLTRAFTATAILSDGSPRDITADPTLSWSTDNFDIATISNTAGSEGVAKGEAKGSVTITATDSSVTPAVIGTASLTVTDAVMTALQVTPPDSEVSNGLTKSYTAIATMSDNTTQEVTTDPAISWASSAPMIASISNNTADKGVAKGESVGGPVTITATGVVGTQTIQDSATLTVSDAIITRLQVTPATESTPVGLSKPFAARAFFSDGTSQDVTDEAALSWSTGDSSIATITTGQTGGGNGIATGHAVGDVDIIASGSVNGRWFEVHSTLTVTAAEIDTSTFEVTPNPETTPVGLSKPFTAKVTLTDGVTVLDITDDPAVSWTVAPAGIATITSGQSRNNGVATGVTSGSAVVTATGTLNGSTFTATADLTVTDAIINRLQVTPIDDEVAEGLTKQYTATAIFSDGTPQDVTADANWLTSLPGIATIDADGLATGVETGETKIKAMYVTPEGNQVFDDTTLTVTDAVITSLEVTPTVKSVPKGIEQQFEATAYYSNGDTDVVTTDTTFLSWTTSGTEVSVDATGLASGDEVGSATVIATANTATDPDGNTLTGAALLRVTDEQIDTIQVTPPTATKPVGQRQAYVATAIMTDGSTYPITNNKRVSWSTSPAGIATITSGIPAIGNGIAKGVATGEATITASMAHFGVTTTGTAAMTVTDAVPVRLEISPLTPSIAKGTDQTFTASVVYSDTNVYPADPADISWASATPTVATIDTTTGVAHGVETGTSLITLSGTVDGVTLNDVSTTLTVTAAEATSLYVVEDTSIAKGRTYPFKAYTVMTAGPDVEVTDSASWQALDPTDTSMASTVASLSTSTLGLATGDEVGTATIQATYGGFTESATLTVTAAVLESITVTPNPLDVGIGSAHTGNLIATGHYSDGTTPTITDLVSWVPGDTSIATVETEDPANPGSTTGGLVTGVTLGTTTAYATMVNSEGDTISSTNSAGDGAPVTINVKRSLESIRVDPENVSVVGVNTANVTAWGTYDDSATEEDITNLVSWNVADSTIAVISNGPEASDGIGGVVSNGTASDGTTTATAELDGITSSNAVSITACNTLAGPCIDAYELSDGKIITNPPSRAYLNLIGVSGGLDFSEPGGSTGPVGTFVATRTYNRPIEPQDICDAYSLNGLKGRTNWIWTTTDDLIELDGEIGDPASARGWPTSANYWWWDGGSVDELSFWALGGGPFSTNNIAHSIYGDPVYTLCTSTP